MPTNQTLDPARKQELIAKIRELPARLVAAVADLPADVMTTHYLAGEWTVAQNVHHLADAHIAAVGRIKQMLVEDHPTLGGQDQDRWAALPDATTADVGGSLAILTGLHERWATLLESLTEAEWQRTGRHPRRGDVTVADLVGVYAGHGAAHLDQIARTLAARG